MRLSLVCEAGPVENVVMHMVEVGESADWLEYVLVVGKAKKKKIFIQEHRWFDKAIKFKLKRKKVSD